MERTLPSTPPSAGPAAMPALRAAAKAMMPVDATVAVAAKTTNINSQKSVVCIHQGKQDYREGAPIIVKL